MPYKKFIKDIGIIIFTNIVIALRGLILLPIITKILGAYNYGLWAQAVALIPFAALLVTLGLPYAMVRFLASEKERKEIGKKFYSIFIITFIIASVLSLILFFSSGLAASFLRWPAGLIKILAFVFLFECLNFIFLHIFRAFQQIKTYSFFIILQSLGEIGFSALAIFSGYGIFGAIVSLLIIRIVIFMAMGAIILKQIGIFLPDFSKIKEYFSFGAPTVLGNISLWLVGSSDMYLVGYFLGASFAGYYGPAWVLGGIVSFLGAPFSFLLPAVLSKLYDEKNIEEVKKYLKYSLKYLLAITIPAFFGLSILARKILLILSTQEIADKGYSLVPLTTFAMVLYSAYGIICLILILNKKTGLLGNIWIIAAFLNIMLNFIFIPRFGIFAAALDSLIAYIFIFSAGCYYSYKYLTFEIDWKFIRKSLFASLLMSLLIIFINPIGTAWVFSAAVFGAIFYGFLIFLLKGIEKKELEFLKSFIRPVA